LGIQDDPRGLTIQKATAEDFHRKKSKIQDLDPLLLSKTPSVSTWGKPWGRKGKKVLECGGEDAGKDVWIRGEGSPEIREIAGEERLRV
jgi:hypothetical protein